MIKGISVHVAPTCAGFKEGSYVCSISLHLQEAVSKTWTHNLMVTRQQLYRYTRAPLMIHPINLGSQKIAQMKKKMNIKERRP
jgi:hypothetical protein